MSGYTADELMATVIAREVRDGETVAVGTLAPIPACGVGNDNDHDVGADLLFIVLSGSVDDTGIRVSFPQLTTERRIGLIKILKDKLEEARVSVRGEREKVWNDIQEKERDGKIPEDEKFKGKEELQKIMDDAHKKLEAIFEKKEKEVMG